MSIMLGIPPSLNIMDESVSVIGKEAKQRKSDGGVQRDMYNERQTTTIWSAILLVAQ